jgi:hypothetical protein
MRTWLAAAGTALLASCAASPSEPFGEAWFACSRDAQCALVEDPADCARIPVNRRYAERFAQRLALAAALEPRRPVCGDGRVRYSGTCASTQCSSEIHGVRRR